MRESVQKKNKKVKEVQKRWPSQHVTIIDCAMCFPAEEMVFSLSTRVSIAKRGGTVDEPIATLTADETT